MKPRLSWLPSTGLRKEQCLRALTGWTSPEGEGPAPELSMAAFKTFPVGSLQAVITDLHGTL